MTTTQKATNGKHKISFEDRTLSHGTPPTKLLGALPLARWIPQDIHSMMDYASGALVASGALMSDDDDAVAKITSLALGGSVIGASAITDYRLSIAKILPIKAHEALDYIWGASAIAAPFVLGYWKKSPRAAVLHVVAGASTILSALFTDYRAFRNRTSKAPAR
jgi:hypothetical protein